ncbi:MAG TPA: CHAD domain-containing protein [Thermoanaerobaculia bacterium]|jgi:CHAD domain-containing protein|nr:CHAD domain-containing protein [Thermoanaerobaculia bacterium]
MAKDFVLRRNESLEAAFRRIATAQLDRVAAALTADDLSRERRVHEARKRFKESRALLRLYRFALGDAFAGENRWYRDAGRALAPYRDASASVAAVDTLGPQLRDGGRGVVNKLRRLVRERRAVLYADPVAVDAVFAALLNAFAGERLRLSDVPLRSGRGALDDGLASAIAAGRKAMARAYATGDDTAFHEWRKRAKDQWYQMQLFLPVWPELSNVREGALDHLSQLLGDHHDVTVVRQLVYDQSDVFGGPAEAQRIGRILSARQTTLAREAWPIAQRLYAALPRHQAGEIVALWKVWHRR